MCWRDGTDRPFPLPAGWVDAWMALMGGRRSSFAGKWTYDAVWEEEVPVLNGYAYISSYESIKMRSDRFVCKLKDYPLSRMELIGDNPNSEVIRYTRLGKKYYLHDLGSKSFNDIPLGPSCHRGLLLTIVPNEPARRTPKSTAAGSSTWMRCRYTGSNLSGGETRSSAARDSFDEP
ncbi:hypothetical protein BS78_02G290000 [Paspalum vaginatum]|nr:hypothetical protein BS78_02G290000 [Paspalum vaginatum]